MLLGHHLKICFLVQVATSLNSAECFLLQSGSSVFTWHGNQCTFEQQQLAAKVAEFLKVLSLPKVFFRWLLQEMVSVNL